MTRLPLLLSLACALSVACGDKDDDSATDGSDGADGAADGADGSDGADGEDGTSGTDGTGGTDGTSGSGILLQGVSISECDDTTSAPRLDASLGGASTINIEHDNFEGNCCADLEVSLSDGGSTLTMVYTDVGEPCDCMCAFDLSYSLINVPSGSYTVYAGGGVSDTVTIP